MKSKQENQNRVFNKKKYDIPKDMNIIIMNSEPG